MRTVGLYRISHPEPHENGVWVMIENQTLEIRESAYIDNGYLPPVEGLPWGSPPNFSKPTPKAE